jgi:hypothetical protein
MVENTEALSTLRGCSISRNEQSGESRTNPLPLAHARRGPGRPRKVRPETVLERAALESCRGVGERNEKVLPGRDLIDNPPGMLYRGSMKITDALRAFLLDGGIKGWTPSTLSSYRSDGEIFKNYIGTDDTRAITKERCHGYTQWLKQRFVPKRSGATGHSPAGIERRINSASSFLRFLKKRGDVPENWFEDVDRPKGPKASSSCAVSRGDPGDFEKRSGNRRGKSPGCCRAIRGTPCVGGGLSAPRRNRYDGRDPSGPREGTERSSDPSL